MTPSGPEKKVQAAIYLFFSLKINYAKIDIFRAIDWPYSVSGWQVMA